MNSTHNNHRIEFTTFEKQDTEGRGVLEGRLCDIRNSHKSWKSANFFRTVHIQLRTIVSVLHLHRFLLLTLAIVIALSLCFALLSL